MEKIKNEFKLVNQYVGSSFPNATCGTIEIMEEFPDVVFSSCRVSGYVLKPIFSVEADQLQKIGDVDLYDRDYTVDGKEETLRKSDEVLVSIADKLEKQFNKQGIVVDYVKADANWRDNEVDKVLLNMDISIEGVTGHVECGYNYQEGKFSILYVKDKLQKVLGIPEDAEFLGKD